MREIQHPPSRYTEAAPSVGPASAARPDGAGEAAGSAPSDAEMQAMWDAAIAECEAGIDAAADATDHRRLYRMVLALQQECAGLRRALHGAPRGPRAEGRDGRDAPLAAAPGWAEQAHSAGGLYL